MKKSILFVLILQSYMIASDESNRLLVPRAVSMSVNSEDLSIKSLQQLRALNEELQSRRSALERGHPEQPTENSLKCIGKMSVPPLACSVAGGVIGAVVCGYPACNDVLVAGFMAGLPFSLLCIRKDYRSYHDDIDPEVNQLTEDLAVVAQAISMKE